MTQGELYEKLSKLEFNANMKSNSPFISDQSITCGLHPDVLKQILGEVKAEFPKQEVKFQGTTFEQKIPKDSKYITQILEWKKKWLGDST